MVDDSTSLLALDTNILFFKKARNRLPRVKYVVAEQWRLWNNPRLLPPSGDHLEHLAAHLFPAALQVYEM